MAGAFYPGDVFWQALTGTPAHLVLAPGALFTVWDDQNSGSKLTNLTAPDGVTGLVTDGSAGNYLAGSDGLRPNLRSPDHAGILWCDSGATFRFPMVPIDVLDVLLQYAPRLNTTSSQHFSGPIDFSAVPTVNGAALPTGGGTSLTSYVSQVQSLADYPAAIAAGSTQVAARAAIGAGASNAIVNTRIASYTAVASDAGKEIEMNVATPNTLTINAGVFSADQKSTWTQLGLGLTTFVAGAGMTLLSENGFLTSAGQYSTGSIRFRSATEAVVSGGLAATLSTPAPPALPVVSGLRGWWKADAITSPPADGGALATWTDSSATGAGAVQATAGNKPTYRSSGVFLPNSKPVVEFTAANGTFLEATVAQNTATTRFMMVRLKTIPAANTATITSSPMQIAVNTTGKLVTAIESVTFLVNPGTATLATGTWYVVAVTDNGTNSHTTYVNGAQDGTTTTAHTLTGTSLVFGGKVATGENLDGYIAEVIDYSRVLTGTELTQVTSYLTTKYAGGSAPLATLYVAKTGNDSNAGTLASPKLTIQAAMSLAAAGTAIYVRAGTYSESLSIGVSGTSTNPITLQNYSGEVVTVNSGTGYAIRTNSAKSWWIIDGLRFLSLPDPAGTRYPSGSVNFADNNESSNDNIIRNCYVQGKIEIVGKRNLVDTCEVTGAVSGTKTWENGIHDEYSTSTDNVFRNNLIHDYKNRAVWSMQATANVLIEGNTCYNIGPSTNGDTPIGIDIDGASGLSPTDSIVRGNTVYNVTSYGIEIESGLRTIVERNTVHDTGFEGILWVNYSTFTNSGVTRNNVLYSCGSGIGVGANSVKIQNNTFHNVGGAIRVAANLVGSCATNTEISNNVFSSSSTGIFYSNSCGTGSGETFRNNLYFNTTSQTLAGETNKLTATNPLFVNAGTFDFHLQSGSPARGSGVTVTGVTVDRDGVTRASPPSRGAYE